MKGFLILLLVCCLSATAWDGSAQSRPAHENLSPENRTIPASSAFDQAIAVMHRIDQMDDPVQIIHALDSAYLLAKKSASDSLIKVVLFQLSFNHNISGDWAKGYEWAMEGIKSVKSDSQNAYYAAFSNMAAQSFEKQRDYATALEWAKKSIRTARNESGNNFLITNRWAARMVAAKYMAYLKYPLDTCLHYGRESIRLGRIDGVPESLFAYSYASMAIAFGANGQTDSAVKYHRRALAMHESISDPFSAQEIERDLAKLYLQLNQQDSAIFYARKVFASAPSVNNWDVRMDAANILSVALEKVDQGASLYYLRTYQHLKDSLFNRDKFNEISLIKTRELLAIRDAADQERRGRNRIITYSLLSGLVLTAMIGIILYRNNQARTKTNRQLAEKNHALELESSLEKVRSRSLAMHRSNELVEVVSSLFDQLKALKIAYHGVGIYLFDKEKKEMALWIASSVSEPTKVNLPFDAEIAGNIINRDLWSLQDKGEDIRNKRYAGQEKDDYYRYIDRYNSSSIPETVRQMMVRAESWTASFAAEKHCALLVDSWEDGQTSNESFLIVKRFARVFEQAYVRFLDLKKAEAQAYEAQIETALERVRSSAMAMQRSDQLAGVVGLMYRQFEDLGFGLYQVLVSIFDFDKNVIEWWSKGFSEDNLPQRNIIPIIDHPLPNQQRQAWESATEYREYMFGGEEKASWEGYLFTKTDLQHFPEHVKAQMRSIDSVCLADAYMKCGVLQAAGTHPLSEKQADILLRFAKVLDQSYTRMTDLQKAEQQAHKAHIEASLERVRARALAMQEPEELVQVAQLLRQEMGALGIEPLETGSVFIHEEGSDRAECWFAIRDDRLVGKPLVSDHISLKLNATWVGREMMRFYKEHNTQVSIPMRGEHRLEWIEYCYRLSPMLNGYYGNHIPDRMYHLCKFSNGAIGAAAPGDISTESWDLLQRTASVFSLAYSRFKDLSQARTDLQRLKEEKHRAETALTELRATQSQLIQSEKMASLGELTAGIAHEIQNPLNFVNNFSDLNKELIEELQGELKKGDIREASSIAENLKDNEEKINLHGRRADGIVKSMLQHSRASGGQKEPTDVNKLVDEYVRLAYHGYRARKKDFNVTLDIQTDPEAGQVTMVAQDIGRVLLNLLNNAFHAVDEKSGTAGEGYHPTVTVSTNRTPQGLDIRVADNGPGIPDNIKDKIFQPFFTTKPTGQGTGLGLSLSYDIIKAHGGEIIAKGGEDSGMTFLLIFPQAEQDRISKRE